MKGVDDLAGGCGRVVEAPRRRVGTPVARSEGRLVRGTGRISLVVGCALVCAAAALCLVSLVWTPYDPTLMDVANRFAPPSPEHLLGTDQFGRDILSRLMAASQPAFGVGLGSVLLGAAVGAAAGLVAGLGGSALRALIMRVVDGLMAFPGILLAMVLVLVLGRGIASVLVAIAVFMVPTFARVACQTTLELRGSLFIKAARSCGCSKAQVALRHVLPNIAAPLITQLTACVGTAMLLEASLSFLGLGVQPPAASWGSMLNEALPYVFGHPSLAVAPGIVLMLVVLGFNLLGDGLNDRLVQGRSS